MRTTVSLLVVLLLAQPVMAANMLEDDAGDHTYTIGSAAGDPSMMPALDLIAVALEETKSDFIFTLEVQELEPQQTEVSFGSSGVQYFIYFSYGGMDYRTATYRITNALDQSVEFFARFQVYDVGSDRFNNKEALNVEADLAADTVTVTVDRDMVLTKDGASPRKDTQLENFFAESHTEAQADRFNAGAPAAYEGGDRMPNDGVSSIQWPIQFGLEQTGNARLDSHLPVRTSNGEATTFVFEIIAANVGDEADSFQMSAAKIPESWEIQFPDKRIKLDGGAAITVPVLITVPFNHRHGFYQPVLIQLESQTNPDGLGQVELGIRYTDTPQPAGHHDKLFLHRGDSNEFFGGATTGIIEDADKYFNTLEEDELASPGDLPRSYPECEGTQLTHVFEIQLAPGLDMGLDFDAARTGLFEGAISSETPMTGVTFSGELLYGFVETTENNGRTNTRLEYETIAVMGPVAMGDVSGPKNVEAEISALAAGDYIPYKPGATVMLRIEVSETFPGIGVGFSCFVNQKQPVIKTGATFTLPLDEYHDVIDGSFAGSSGLELLAENGLKAFVNPGKAILFDIRAENLAEATAMFDLSLTGTNVEWAQLASEPHLMLDAGEVAKVRIAIIIPAQATDGQTVDISLVATSSDDPNISSVIRMVAEVDTDAEYPDQTEEVNALFAPPVVQESPGLPLLLVLGAIFLARRRK